jgi:3-oxoacyl-[acyl-carrier protein] reductase
MSAGQYSDQVVLVTGARKGIGRALADHFLANDATVLGIGRTEGSIDHPSYHHFLCDVRDGKAVRTTFQAIAKDWPLHIVVNNSGVLDSKHSFMLPATSAEEMLATNLLGPFLVSREAAKVMKQSGWGRIISIGSMAAALEPVGDSVYAATKAGLVTLTNVLAREFAPFGITCNTVGVTALETDMLQQLPRDAVDRVIAGLPLPRLAEEEDIFNVVDFFASRRSSYVTAQTVYLGGLHA